MLLCMTIIVGLFPNTATRAGTDAHNTTENGFQYVGDVDGDGSVTPKDVTKMRRFLAGGWDVEVATEDGDVDGDGAITPKDVTKLRRYLAGGWGVTLTEKDNDDILLYQKVDTIIQQLGLTAESPALLKVREIHDWMVLNISYDGLWLKQIAENKKDSSGEKYGITIRDASNDRPAEPKWVLSNKLAVCQGYSELFKIFMERLGIQCKVIGSDTMNHAWNLVLMDDGHWYHVDVTWDDPGYEDAWDIGWYNIGHLLRNDDGISIDHSGWPTDTVKADGTFYEENLAHSVNYKRKDTSDIIEYDDNGFLRRISYIDYFSGTANTIEFVDEVPITETKQGEENTEIVYYSENGVKQKSETKNNQGVIIYQTEYYENGNIKKAETLNDQGVIVDQTEYYESGSIKSRLYTYDDGQVGIGYFNEEGVEVKTVWKNAAGEITAVLEYDDNGNPK